MMTDKILEFAKKVHLIGSNKDVQFIEQLTAFANLIRQDEREQCAKIAMDMPLKADESHDYRDSDTGKAVAWDISIAIKKRGE